MARPHTEAVRALVMTVASIVARMGNIASSQTISLRGRTGADAAWKKPRWRAGPASARRSAKKASKGKMHCASAKLSARITDAPRLSCAVAAWAYCKGPCT